jgi:hypothetical protein
VLISQLPNSDVAVGGLAGVPPEQGLQAFHAAVAVLLIMAAMAVFFATQVRDRPSVSAKAVRLPIPKPLPLDLRGEGELAKRG